MNRHLAAALVAALPIPAAAQGLTTYLGFAVVSDYVSSGETQTDGGPAFQPYVELEHASGLYGGVWASNVDFGGPDSWEIDVYAGYRTTFGPVSVDLGYFRYYYDDTGFDSDELILSLGYGLGDSLSLNTDLSTDFEGYEYLTQGFEFGLPMDVAVSGEATVDDTGYWDWNLGIGRQFTDTIAIDVRYHDSEGTRPRYTLGLSFDTSIGG